MAHLKKCRGCGGPFFPSDSILDTRCPKCQPGAGGDPSTLLNTAVAPIDMATLPNPSPFSEVALGVTWPRCEDCGGELELIRPHVWDCPKCSVANTDVVLFDEKGEAFGPYPLSAFYQDGDVQELTPEAKFWRARIEQQVDYIARFDKTKRTRPDVEAVRESAVYILEQCQENYLRANNHTNDVHQRKEVSK